MGLTQALATSLSGLQATQAGLSVVAGNVANAQTAGYVAKSVTQSEVPAPATTATACACRRSTACSTRSFNSNCGRKAPAAPTPTSTPISISNLQQVYGQPGSSTTLNSVFQRFHQRRAGAVHQPQFLRGAKPDHQRRAGSGAATQQRDAPVSSRCALRPTRASPTTCSRPTMPCSRSRTSISNSRAAAQPTTPDGHARGPARPICGPTREIAWMSASSTTATTRSAFIPVRARSSSETRLRSSASHRPAR